MTPDPNVTITLPLSVLTGIRRAIADYDDLKASAKAAWEEELRINFNTLCSEPDRVNTDVPVTDKQLARWCEEAISYRRLAAISYAKGGSEMIYTLVGAVMKVSKGAAYLRAKDAAGMLEKMLRPSDTGVVVTETCHPPVATTPGDTTTPEQAIRNGRDDLRQPDLRQPDLRQPDHRPTPGAQYAKGTT